MSKPEFLTTAGEHREAKAQLDECRFVFEVLAAKQNPGIMIDVGAHYGGSLRDYVKSGWQVWAFEPDAKNRSRLIQEFGEHPCVHISQEAVSDKIDEDVAFFVSEVSTGISGLSAFHDSHKQSTTVKTTTLSSVITREEIPHIDFLKIDVEGFEMAVLNGLDFTAAKPRAIVAEFEDRKSEQHGYKMKDLAEKLVAQDYVVFVSEWHPITQYGTQHSWRRLRRYPFAPAENSWGNLVAFANEPTPDVLQNSFFRSLIVPSIKKDNTAEATKPKILAPEEKSTYKITAEKLIVRHPVLSRFLRFGIWSAKAMSKRIFGFSGALAISLSVLAFGAISKPDLWWAWLSLSVIVSAGALVFLAVGYSQFLFNRRETGQTRAFSHLEQAQARLMRKVDGTNTLFHEEKTTQKTENEKLSRRLLDVAQENERLLAVTQELEAQNIRLFDALHKLTQQTNGLETSSQDTAKDFRGLEEKISQLTNSTVSHDDYAKQVDRMNTDLLETKRLAQHYSDQLKQFPAGNAPQARPHARLLAPEKSVHFLNFWVKSFDLDLSSRQLAYMAHKICLIEDIADGRIAAPIETILLRLLATHSLKGEKLDILEIGTLFGIASGALYNLRKPIDRDIHLTLLDPMEGYYDRTTNDPVTGVPVSQRVLESNLRALNVPDAAWRLIKKLSTDEDAITVASDRTYDMIIIDGDHSVDGVARDFEIYGNLVKPGGLLIFDDYDTEDWPGIKPYVDDNVRPDPNWIWIGGDFRTGILRRKFDSDAKN